MFDKRWLVDQKHVVRGAASGQELSRYSLHSPWPFFYGHFSCQEGVETAGRQDPEASLWVQWYLGCTCCTWQELAPSANGSLGDGFAKPSLFGEASLTPGNILDDQVGLGWRSHDFEDVRSDSDWIIPVFCHMCCQSVGAGIAPLRFRFSSLFITIHPMFACDSSHRSNVIPFAMVNLINGFWFNSHLLLHCPIFQWFTHHSAYIIVHSHLWSPKSSRISFNHLQSQIIISYTPRKCDNNIKFPRKIGTIVNFPIRSHNYNYYNYYSCSPCFFVPRVSGKLVPGAHQHPWGVQRDLHSGESTSEGRRRSRGGAQSPRCCSWLWLT